MAISAAGTARADWLDERLHVANITEGCGHVTRVQVERGWAKRAGSSLMDA